MADTLFVDDSGDCDMVRTAVAQDRISMRVVDVEHDHDGREQFFQTGSCVVPTAIVDGRAIVGASKIVSALRLKHRIASS